MAGNNQTQPGAAVPVYSSMQASVLCKTATLVAKTTAGTVGTVNVLAGGSTTGAIFDSATTAAISSTANLVALIPPATGPVVLNFPCLVGIVIQPGTGQTLSVSYT